MSHPRQQKFCNAVRSLYPSYFHDTKVIDAGSLNINGTNRSLFKNCQYIGVDIKKGKNVDLICTIHKVEYPENVDCVISTEMLEHDVFWKESLHNMYKLLKKNGLMIITCAGPGRKEHGTKLYAPKASPATINYYKNLFTSDVRSILPETMFKNYYLKQKGDDINFYGIKK